MTALTLLWVGPFAPAPNTHPLPAILCCADHELTTQQAATEADGLAALADQPDLVVLAPDLAGQDAPALRAALDRMGFERVLVDPPLPAVVYRGPHTPAPLAAQIGQCITGMLLGDAPLASAPPPNAISDVLIRALEHNTQPVALTDGAGRIGYFNPAFARQTGWMLDELRGSVVPVLAQDAGPRWAELHSAGCWHGEFANQRRNGEAYWEAVSITPIYDERGTLMHWCVQAEDITSQKQALETLTASNTTIQLLYEAAKRLSKTLDLDTIYATLHDIVGHIMPCSSLFVSSYHADEQLIRCVSGWSDAHQLDVSHFPPIPLEEEGHGTQSIAIRTGQALYLADYQRHLHSAQTHFYVEEDSSLKALDEVDEDADVPRSALIVPLKLGSQVLGVAQVFSTRLNAYSENDLHILEALAGQVAAAMANAELYRQTQREVAERRRAEAAEREQRTLAEALTDTAVALNRSLDLQTVFKRILANVDRVVPHDAATIALLETEQGETYARFVQFRGYDRYGLDKPIESLRLAVSQYTNLNSMVMTRRPFIIDDTMQNPHWVKPIAPNPLRAYLGAPIQQHDEVVGVISLRSETPGFFTAQHAERLQAFAEQAAIAIRNARLFEAVQNYALELEQRVEERTAALAAREEQYRAQYRGIPVPTLTLQRVDDDFIITDYNDTMLATTEGGVVHLLGARASAVFREAPEVITHLWRCYNKRTTIRSELFYTLRTTGRIGYYQMSLAFIPPDFVLLHGIDLTERKRAEQALEATLAREKELSEMKSRFISTVSHEFRTPLAIIQSSVEMLKIYGQRLSDEEKLERFERIEHSIQRATRLLDNVLTVSRADAGRLAFHPTQVDAVALCQQIVHDIGLNYPAITFRCDVSGACSPITADEHLLQLILNNLVLNAAKYSPAGSSVDVSLDCQPDNGLVLTVQDHGIGIPEQDRPHIFDMFFRARNAEHIGGTGVGLAIARQSAAQHGGTITFESEVGRGTTFTVTLPTALPRAD